MKIKINNQLIQQREYGPKPHECQPKVAMQMKYASKIVINLKKSLFVTKNCRLLPTKSNSQLLETFTTIKNIYDPGEELIIYYLTSTKTITSKLLQHEKFI